jgi:hypothetical protein
MGVSACHRADADTHVFLVYTFCYFKINLYLCSREYDEETILRIMVAIGSLCANDVFVVASCS